MAILEDVRSLYNVGSIFRTADAAGLEQVFLTGITGTPEHRGIRKTALGAEQTVSWTHFKSSQEAIDSARAQGFQIAVLEITDNPRRLETLTLEDFPLCLVVGNEVSGVSDQAVAEADFAIEIPQFGHKHSLNAAVAFGVAIFGVIGAYRGLRFESSPAAEIASPRPR